MANYENARPDWDMPVESEMTASDADERVDLMQAFVNLDRDLRRLHEEQARNDERIKHVTAKQREIRSRLSDALGFSGKEPSLDSLAAKFAPGGVIR